MRQSAFSLLELLVVMVIGSVLIATATISYRSFIRNNHLSLAIDQLQQVLMSARQLALLHQQSITICPSSDQKHCGALWQQGQLLMMNKKPLQIFPALKNDLQYRWVGSFAVKNRIEFEKDGTTRGQQGHFAIEKRDKQLLAKLYLTHSGRVRVLYATHT